jgi:hypothetical protein
MCLMCKEDFISKLPIKQIALNLVEAINEAGDDADHLADLEVAIDSLSEEDQLSIFSELVKLEKAIG